MKVEVIETKAGHGVLDLEAETPCDRETILAISTAKTNLYFIQSCIGDSSIKIKIGGRGLYSNLNEEITQHIDLLRQSPNGFVAKPDAAKAKVMYAFTPGSPRAYPDITLDPLVEELKAANAILTALGILPKS